MISTPGPATTARRLPGYGLEADIERVMHEWFDVDNSGEAHFTGAVEALVAMLRDRGYLAP
jgi:hypothetical protein